MRILIDLQSCQTGSSLGGIGRYSMDLAKAMVCSSPSDEFIVILNNRNPASITEVRREFRNILPPNAIQVFDLPQGSFIESGHAVVTASEAIREKFIADMNPDAVHLSSLFEGLRDEVATSIAAAGPPTAVTLYDLIPIAQQDLYLGADVARDHYFNKFEHLKKASAILAISQFSADEGRHFLGSDCCPIVVNMRGGIDHKFRRLPRDTPGFEDVVKRFELANGFFMYTASFDQRKNQARLIKAFAGVPAGVRKNRKLVVVGNGWPEIYRELENVAASSGLKEGEVVFTGRLSDDDLIALYNQCHAFVFPPLWEGLGLPPLEAMACGAPVIGSKTTSIPEVIGLESALFDPRNIKEMSRLIQRTIDDPAYYQSLKTHVDSHHRQFTWDASAQIALTAIKQMAADARQPASTPTAIKHPGKAVPAINGLPDGFTQIPDFPAHLNRQFAYCLAANEMEAGLLTNLPPTRMVWLTSWATRCGIASYSKNLVDHLPAGIEILASKYEPAVPDTALVHRCWMPGREDDLTELAEKLNALDVTDVVIQFNYSFFNFTRTCDLVEDQIRRNRRVYFTLHATKDPIPSVRLADLQPALAMASAVFVHSDNDVARLRDIGITSNVVVIPQGVRLIDTPLVPKPVNARKRISSYGFFLPGKGLNELIEAFALLCQKRKDVELYMVNANYGDTDGWSDRCIAEAKQKASGLGLDGRVTMITDYLTDEESIAHLRTADLIVYPYQQTGESSSAAVRMGLASGRPVAVTPLAIFDDVRNATHRLPGISPSDMAAGMDRVLDCESNRAPEAEKIGKSAAAWCASNDVRFVADYMNRIITQRGASQIWEVFAQPPLESLALLSGIRDRGQIKSNAAPAALVHGPYLTLPPGLYQILVKGSAISTASAAADVPVGQMKLSADCGSTTLKTVDILAASGQIADSFFNVAGTISNFEVTLIVHENSAINLTGYQILRRRFR